MITVSYPTLNRHLRGWAANDFRRTLAAACARLGPASLVLYDCSTLYFETATGNLVDAVVGYQPA